MSLENIVPDGSVERGHYHLLTHEELNKLDDAEALFVRGDRFQAGVGIAIDEEAGWRLIIESAKLGHPVALACCFQYAKGTLKNLQRAAELYRQAADRGHPAGIVFALIAIAARNFLLYSNLLYFASLLAATRISDTASLFTRN
jgi:TPR repeat protein